MKKYLNRIFLVVVGLVTTAIQFSPDVLLHLWTAIPDDLKASLPPVFVKRFTFVLMAVTYGGKMLAIHLDRNNLRKQVNDSTSD